MDITGWLPLALAVLTFATPALSAEPRVVCYYTNWSVYRPGTARFNPQNINPYLCTHLVYAFGGFTKDNTLKPFDKYQDIEKGGYAKFNGLKTYNKNLKTLLAIGGWNEGSSRFSPMVASRDRRKEFVRNVIKFLRQNHFDGLDLDWEYPAFRDGGKPKDRENYAKLVRELREEFERESQKTGKPRLLLTMAVPAGIEYIEKGFDIETLNKYLDWMNLLSYDYHSAFEPAVNHHAPLYPLEEPNEYSVDNELNIDYTIKFYLENGVDRDKLVLGIPTYGRSYTLFNPDAVEIGSPADGPGEQGDATREKGYLAYYEICEALKPKTRKRSLDSESEEYSDEEEVEEEWTVMHPNPKAMGPVAFKGNQWVGYDDIDIVKKKGEYVAENGLGGIMFWSIDNDDFRGNCHGKPYPLIEAAKESYILKLGSTDNTVLSEKPKSRSKSGGRRRNRPRTTSTTITTTTTTTTTEKPSTRNHKRKSGSKTSTTPSWNIITPEPPTTPDPGSDFKCTDEGFFPHPRDCKKYFWCLDSGPSNLGIVANQFTCPSGLYFNKAADSCDFSRNVLCKMPAATTKAPTTKAPTTKTTVTTTTTTTTRKPIRLSTKSSALFRTTSTTPEPETAEEYDSEEDETGIDDAEDPKVIKELIDLIKKVGGVEQLEKQLGLSETSISTSGVATSTPASFNKRLYQKVLERTRGKSNFYTNSVNESPSQNSRRGPQNEGLQPSADKDRLLKKERPQYVTINRSRSPSATSTTEESLESEEIDDEPELDEQQLTRGRAVGFQAKVATTAKPLQYVNIRRPRPTTTTVSDSAENAASRNALFERVEPYVSVSEAVNSLDISSARRENIPEYVTIKRNRPTTETTTEQYQNSETEVESQESALEREISSPSLQPQYTSILRTRSTTLSPIEEPSSPEPTTILSVQISSLLNSPTVAEAQSLDPSPSVLTTTEAVEVSTTTSLSPSTSTTTLATTTSVTDVPSTTTPRRNGLRRRGSTTTSSTTTPSPISTTQVSSRNYNLVRRRRPLSTPNEVSSESEESAFSRKIRSTTPDSREVDGGKLFRETGQSKRFRSRYQFSVDDSLPAAASPVSRGILGPQSNTDKEHSLSSVDIDLTKFLRKETSDDDSYAEISDTVNDETEDSEISATTVEDHRSDTISRGRGRYSNAASTDAIVQLTTTDTTFTQRRPTFARFSPRPFVRSTLKPFRNRERLEGPVLSSRTVPRVPFNRPKLSSSVSTTVSGLQARRLPFPSRPSTSTTTTEQTLISENGDDDLENKRDDDIYLSESAIEEKEHEDNIQEIEEGSIDKGQTEKLTTREFTTTENYNGETVTSDTGVRKFKVIRRRPTSTTAPTETTSTPMFTEITTSTIPRVRKIIRKKLKPTEDEIETTTKSANTDVSNRVTGLAFNYGDKTKSTTITSVATERVQDAEEVPEEPNFESNKQQPKLKDYRRKQEDSAEEPESDGELGEPDTKDNSQFFQFPHRENEKEQLNVSLSDQIKQFHEKETNKSIFVTNQDQVSTKESDDNDLTENFTGRNVLNKPVVSEHDILQNVLVTNDDSTSNSETLAVQKETDDLSDVNVKEYITQNDSMTFNGATDNPSKEKLDILQTATNKEGEVFNGTLNISTESEQKADVVVESNDEAIDLSEIQDLAEPSLTQLNDTIENRTETTTSSTTLSTSPSLRTRLPYRPPKRLFTSTTASSIPSSSRIFSRKYNPGAYTSPKTVEKEPFAPSVTRRPLFSRTFTRRPFTTARTTKRVEEDEYSDDELLDEEILEEEPENPFVFVPHSQLFTRKPDSEEEYEDEGTDEFEEASEEEIYDEEQPEISTTRKFTATSRKPQFKPRVVNSNTFRTSTTTTELPKRQFAIAQNKTTVYNRFGSNKPINDLKKRVQNVPTGYNIPKLNQNIPFNNKTTKTVSTKVEEVIYASDSETTTAEHDEYLSITETTTTQPENSNTSIDNATTNTETETVTVSVEFDNNTDEYLENTEKSVIYPSTLDVTTVNLQTESITSQSPELEVTTLASVKYTYATTDALPETTTNVPMVSPIVKTQYNKLFSISRVVEVSSKQDKHHLNKNNLTTLIEEGPIVIEKKPTVDKIGEVSRFSLIKIVEDEIPIYLTKLGHVYPVDNPPNNPIRIDEARNARALISYDDYPKENLVASESIAYRHINKITTQRKENMLKREVEHIPADQFLRYVNNDNKTGKVHEYQEDHPWQFVPAAYEGEQTKKANILDIVTPRIMLSNPSTLPLEALFKTESPITKIKDNDDKENRAFFVYSVAVPTEKEIIKPESSPSIVTLVRGQKSEQPSIDQSNELRPINISIISETIESASTTTISPNITTDKITTSPIVELLITKQVLLTTPTPKVTISTTNTPLTTETLSTETSTVKTLPIDTKRSKFPFARRPIIEASNLTRLAVFPRASKKINTTIKANFIQKSNKTTFTPRKSRFSANRAQNVPVDARKNTNFVKFVPKTFTTDSPRSTTEKKIFTKTKRPTFRPAFVPRRSTIPISGDI